MDPVVITDQQVCFDPFVFWGVLGFAFVVWFLGGPNAILPDSKPSRRKR